MKQSIKVKLTIFVMIIILLVIGMQIAFNRYFALSFFFYEKGNQIERLYQQIEDFYLYSEGDLGKIIMPYEENDHIRVMIWDENGKVIYNTVNEAVSYKYSESDFLYEPKIIYRENERTGDDSLMILGRVNSDGGIFKIAIETPTAAVHHSVQLILKLNMMIGLIALIFGCICAWWVGKRFTKPILVIDNVAQAVADLDFSKKVDFPLRNDEIGTLGNNINIMSAQLSDLIEKLQIANQQLEKDVDYQKQIDNMRKEFTANVSHELKSPLSLLIMYCENLKEDLPHIDKAFYYDVIISESLRLGELVKNLLEVSALENGMTKMKKEIFDFSKLSQWVCTKNDVLFQDKGIQFKALIEKGIFISGDTFYLEQAIQNYLDNAIAHTEPEREVAACLMRKAHSVRFSVFNEGSPISEEDLNQIWDSFYKSDRARTHAQEKEIHAGLGLHIVRTIITAHGGEYGVVNQEKGVEFWFSLPVSN